MSKRTINVRIAVIVNSKGEWSSAGWPKADDAELMAFAGDGLGEAICPEARYFVTAELELPEANEIVGAVEKEALGE